MIAHALRIGWILRIYSGRRFERKTDPAIWLFRMLRKFIDHLEDDGELIAYAQFECFEAFVKLYLRSQQFPQPDERPHNLDIHLHGSFAPKHTAQHGYALLGERIGSAPSAAPT